jgi:hypothetical protein
MALTHSPPHSLPHSPPQIIGMDSEPVKDDKEEYLLLHRHFNKLFETRLYRESNVVFIPENNLGLESAHLDTMVSDITGVTTFWEKDSRPGVAKTATVTRGYLFIMNLMLSEGTLRFERDCFTVTKEQTTSSMRDMLQDQMLRMHWEVKRAPDVHGKDRHSLTGKVGNKQDDLLVTVAMVLYWGRNIMQDRSRLEG